MCSTCGCGSHQIRIGEIHRSTAPQSAVGIFNFSQTNLHPMPNNNEGQKTLIKLEQDILGKNNQIAQSNRLFFQQQGMTVLNLVSSPGSGKTSLLTASLNLLKDRRTCYVIEGDQQTEKDAERIRTTGVTAIQVNTGKGCHLDAKMIQDALFKLQPVGNSLLFIENVGNLVCPSEFDLGEQAKAVILSVTEGEDKPLKYPHIFAASQVMVLNKIDLLPYVDFDVEKCIGYAKQVNPAIEILQLSATTGEGLSQWLNWIEK